MFDTALCLALGSSEDKTIPAAEVPQQADVVERTSKEKEGESPPHSPADKPTSRGSASSSSEHSSSNSSEEDDDGQRNGTQRKIRSSVAQIRVSIHLCITLTIASMLRKMRPCYCYDPDLRVHICNIKSLFCHTEIEIQVQI